MSYVDLNPVRAGLSESLEDSDYTSVQQRIEHLQQRSVPAPVRLADFMKSSHTNEGIAFSLQDYLEITDWTGRCIHPKKKGFIPESKPHLLHQLMLDENTWLETVTGFQLGFKTLVGSEQQIKTVCQQYEKKWAKGLSLCRRLFKTPNLLPYMSVLSIY